MKLRLKFRTVRRQQALSRGFTLLELMLVMVVMVILASLAAPMVSRLLEGQKVDRGADLARATLGRARVTAIRTGKIQAFVCQPGSAAMVVAPLEAIASGSFDLNSRFQSAPEEMRDSNFDFSDELLPRGVRFTTLSLVENSRSNFEMETSGASNDSQMKYILFYPDGTSQDAQLVVANDRGFQQRIVVRGLTGTSRVLGIADP